MCEHDVYGCPDSTACTGCRCPDPDFMRSGETDQERGYHWEPFQWVCDLCGLREIAELHDPVIVADGVTICDSGECLGTIVRGIEALRKAGLAVHAGRMDAYKLETGQQVAEAFYSELAKAGRVDG